ncbi:MAG: type 3 dihydrofolate reductase [Legionellales bacterium]|nr:type 3 dihydrofolate reductase [Legionellales bacterium]
MISLIAALAHHRVIGYQNQLPWHMPNDLAFFQEKTLYKPVIMGRRSFESLGKPLPQRRNIIVTRNRNYQAAGCDVVHSLTAAIELVKQEPEIMITGGAHIYRESLTIADRMYLTFIDAEVPGDTFFPEWDSDAWEIISREEYSADDKNPYDYSFVIFDKIKN